MASEENQYIEGLCAKFRTMQKEEAIKQMSISGNLVEFDMADYEDLPDNIKVYYRIIAQFFYDKMGKTIDSLRFYGEQKNWVEIQESGVIIKNAYDDMGSKARAQLDDMGFSYDKSEEDK